ETFLLHDSVRNNLLWAKPDASELELRTALEMAAAGFVDQLSKGMDTVIGDRGVRVSGGERQRLALARALLRRPDLLILDEATSSLDAENQARIQAAIQQMQGQLTVVVIAHRLSTIQHADQIVVLDGGQIAETGCYHELAANRQGVLHALICADRGSAKLAG
ncbi:MAG: ATP-binding cassette domain-containing protein, partial [Planctomycetales bacterium]